MSSLSKAHSTEAMSSLNEVVSSFKAPIRFAFAISKHIVGSKEESKEEVIEDDNTVRIAKEREGIKKRLLTIIEQIKTDLESKEQNFQRPSFTDTSKLSAKQKEDICIKEIVKAHKFITL